MKKCDLERQTDRLRWLLYACIWDYVYSDTTRALMLIQSTCWYLNCYASVGRAQRHTVTVLCLCVCAKLSRALSPCPLKIKHWNLQCKLNTILSWNKIGGFWIGSFIVELWCDLRSVAHLDGCFSLSGVRRIASCLQSTAFQLGSSIGTTRQTMS